MSLRETEPPGDPAGEAPPEDNETAQWAWQSFDQSPRRWHQALRHAQPSGGGYMRSETYLLTRHSTNLVKLRQDRVDVKRLMATEPSGMEAWATVRRLPLPLSPPVIAELCTGWQCDPPRPCPTIRTVDDFHAFLAQQLPEVRVLPARSWRREYRLLECQAERRTILVGGNVLELLAIRHPDLATLRTTLHALDLGKGPTTSVLTALRQLLGWPADRNRPG